MMLRKFALVLIALPLLAGCSGFPGWVRLMRPAPVHSSDWTGDPARGDTIFHHGKNEAPPCSTCHQTVKGAFGFALGPNLAEVGTRAASRIDGMTAAEYITDSILHPKHFVVPGYQDIMYPDFAKHFSPQDVADLVAYLMTL